MKLSNIEKTLIWVIVLGLIAIGVLRYRLRSLTPDLNNVEPHAREEIEKTLRH